MCMHYHIGGLVESSVKTLVASSGRESMKSQFGCRKPPKTGGDQVGGSQFFQKILQGGMTPEVAVDIGSLSIIRAKF